jgi:GTP-binding protein
MIDGGGLSTPPPVNPSRWRLRPMPPRIHKAVFVKAVVRPDQAPPPLPAVAFAGRSNVGKSSLINKLTGVRGLARTSSTPGRTQEIIYFEIDERWHFVDLPGYGFAKAPLEVKRRWGPMIEKFLRTAPSLQLIVLILDARRDPTPDDMQMIRWLEARGDVPYIFAVTKTDKLGRAELARRLVAIQKALGLESDDALVPVSAETGAGMSELFGVVRSALTSRPAAGDSAAQSGTNPTA